MWKGAAAAAVLAVVVVENTEGGVGWDEVVGRKPGGGSFVLGHLSGRGQREPRFWRCSLIVRVHSGT